MVDKKIFEDIIERIKNENNAYLKTGFVELDDFLHLEEGALITIGGRPAMGKTSFIYNLLENISQQGKKCLLFSLEMSMECVIQRLLCQVAKIDTKKIRTKNMQSDDWEKMSNAMEKLVNVDFLIDDTSNITIKNIAEKINKIKPDVVFIDYLQLINYDCREDKNTNIEDIIKRLKHIARENGIVIFVNSQLSRAVECRKDQRPILSDLRYSNSIENISDVIIFIYRHEYYHLDEEDLYNKGIAEIIVAKNHFGPCGTINLLYNSKILNFSSRVNETVF